jgi:hypothetical protein
MLTRAVDGSGRFSLGNPVARTANARATRVHTPSREPPFVDRSLAG